MVQEVRCACRKAVFENVAAKVYVFLFLNY